MTLSSTSQLLSARTETLFSNSERLWVCKMALSANPQQL
jgi:hypothetical protein